MIGVGVFVGFGLVIVGLLVLVRSRSSVPEAAPRRRQIRYPGHFDASPVPVRRSLFRRAG